MALDKILHLHFEHLVDVSCLFPLHNVNWSKINRRTLFSRGRIPDLFGLKGQLSSYVQAREIGLAHKISRALLKPSTGGVWVIMSYAGKFSKKLPYSVSNDVRRTHRETYRFSCVRIPDLFGSKGQLSSYKHAKSDWPTKFIEPSQNPQPVAFG